MKRDDLRVSHRSFGSYVRVEKVDSGCPYSQLLCVNLGNHKASDKDISSFVSWMEKQLPDHVGCQLKNLAASGRLLDYESTMNLTLQQQAAAAAKGTPAKAGAKGGGGDGARGHKVKAAPPEGPHPCFGVNLDVSDNQLTTRGFEILMVRETDCSTLFRQQSNLCRLGTYTARTTREIRGGSLYSV